MSISRIRKAVVAGIAFAAVLATQLPPGSPEWLTRWAPVVITAAAVLGVYGTRNTLPQVPPSAAAKVDPGPSRIATERPPVPPPPDPGKRRLGQ